MLKLKEPAYGSLTSLRCVPYAPISVGSGARHLLSPQMSVRHLATRCCRQQRGAQSSVRKNLKLVPNTGSCSAVEVSRARIDRLL